jgi:uncharacterized YigZ family protein
MLFTTTYKEIVSDSSFLYKSKGSKFLAFTFKVAHEQAIKNHLSILKQQYADATHHCYAYVLNIDKSATRANDDGEPSNTAGKPILRQIQSMDLTNVLVVIIRYFGGTMLGVPGLIEAYGEAALGSLKASGVIEKNIEELYYLSCDFGFENEIYRIGKHFDLDIKPIYNEQQFCAEIKIPLLHSANFKQQLTLHYHIQHKYIGIA